MDHLLVLALFANVGRVLSINPVRRALEKHRNVRNAMVAPRMDGHVVDLVTVTQKLRDKELQVEDGVPNDILNRLAGWMILVPTVMALPTSLAELKEKYTRRWTQQEGARMIQMAVATDLPMEQIRAEFAELYEQSGQIGASTQPLIDVISPEQARAFEPDPADYFQEDILGNVVAVQFVEAGPFGSLRNPGPQSALARCNLMLAADGLIDAEPPPNAIWQNSE